MDRARLTVIGTGGTISSVTEDTLDVLDYPEFGHKLPIDELLVQVPEAARLFDITAVDFATVPSTALGFVEWLGLARRITELAAAAPAPAGFVITHGTATMEETAYFLGLVLKVPQPVVLTGAQRPMSAVSTDARMNLIAALRTAASPAARGLGVLVVLNDEIHAAREVTKTSTYRLQTFRTPDFGVLGHVDGDGVQILRRPVRAHTTASTFDIAAIASLPRVDIAYSYGGGDGTAIDAFIAAGAAGIVLAGFAPGMTSPDERDAVERALAAGVAVVMASRAGSGRVAPRRYLRENGIIAADGLNPQKARILLALALTRTRDVPAIQEFFATH